MRPEEFTEAEVKRMYELHRSSTKTTAELEEAEKHYRKAIRIDRICRKERMQEEEKEERI